jgi:REP-associated tyrosine transposase
MHTSKARRSVRLKEYDYSQSGGYFVTICTRRKEALFGALIDDRSLLNELGELVSSRWRVLPEEYPTVTIDEYVVMPDHLHGILIINNTGVGAGSPYPSSKPATNLKETGRRNGAPTLGAIIGYFKYQCAKQINLLLKTPGAPVWQRNYYEHVIRSEDDLSNIRRYVKYNPQKIEY